MHFFIYSLCSTHFLVDQTCLVPYYCLLGSLVRPKVVRSVHYCPQTKKTLVRRYTDLTSLDAFPTSSVYPTKVTLVFGSLFNFSNNVCLFSMCLKEILSFDITKLRFWWVSSVTRRVGRVSCVIGVRCPMSLGRISQLCCSYSTPSLINN